MTDLTLYDDKSIAEINVIAERMTAMSEMADAINVVDDDTLIEATAALDALESNIKVLDAIIEPFRKRAYDHYQGVLADKKAFTARAKDAVGSLRKKVGEYRAETQKRLREAQERAVEEGDAKDLVVAEKTAALTDNVGISYREYWKADCVDIVALCRAIGDYKAPAKLVSFNQTEGNKLAKALKELLDNIPGLKSRVETGIVRGS